MANSEPDKPRVWHFEWDGGRGEVAALGGMLAPVWFKLPDGREVQPFAIAPWADEEATPDDLPGILKRLRGEWPCVPFGMSEPPASVPADWRGDANIEAGFHQDPHGASSNYDWHLIDQFGTGLEIGFDYPESHPVERLVRRIEGRASEAAVDISLEIHMRRDSCLPIGLHPVFALPDTDGAAQLELQCREAVTFPAETEPGVSRLLPAGRSSDLRKMPLANGGTLDVSELPLAGETEELVQVAVDSGVAKLVNRHERHAVELRWNEDQFPFCLLWISNKGRSQAPWKSRHLAIGVEPVAAAFDLGVQAGCDDNNPMRTLGSTAQQLLRNTPFKTHYSISVASFSG